MIKAVRSSSTLYNKSSSDFCPFLFSFFRHFFLSLPQHPHVQRVDIKQPQVIEIHQDGYTAELWIWLDIPSIDCIRYHIPTPKNNYSINEQRLACTLKLWSSGLSDEDSSIQVRADVYLLDGKVYDPQLKRLIFPNIPVRSHDPCQVLMEDRLHTDLLINSTFFAVTYCWNQRTAAMATLTYILCDTYSPRVEFSNRVPACNGQPSRGSSRNSDSDTSAGVG